MAAGHTLGLRVRVARALRRSRPCWLVGFQVIVEERADPLAGVFRGGLVIADVHDSHVRLEVEQSGGRLINITGDGTFSLFDGPADAVRCADEIRKAAEKLGISVRAGVHTGELERTGRDFTGSSVHIGARVGAMAMPDEVMVSRAVYDLVAGSGLAFVERGERTLKGVPGSWQLYALAASSSRRCCRPRGRSRPRSTVLCFPPPVLRPGRCAPSCESATLCSDIASGLVASSCREASPCPPSCGIAAVS